MKHYHQLSKDKTTANNETVNNVRERFQKETLITNNLVERLKTISPRAPTIIYRIFETDFSFHVK